jgi:hypothetical protein
MEFPPHATLRAVVTVRLAAAFSISTFPAFSPSPSPGIRVFAAGKSRFQMGFNSSYLSTRSDAPIPALPTALLQ